MEASTGDAMDATAVPSTGATIAAAVNGVHTADGAPGTSADPDNPLVKKFNELTAAVKAKPDEFSSWTSLLSTVEKLDDINHIRSTYDAFFGEYPLCYGYWKKYAEAERRHGSNEAATAVYERGCAATPYSTDLWVAYAAFLLASDATTDAVRSVYERALAYVGTDFLSHSIWDKFIDFEGSHGSPASVAALYSRVLACPIKELEKYHTGLLDYASSRTAHELLSEEAAAAFRGILEQQAADKQAAAAAAAEAARAAAAAAADAANATKTGDAAVDGASKPEAEQTAAAAETAAAAVKEDDEPEVAPGEEPEQPDAAGAAAAAPMDTVAGDAAAADGIDAEMTDADAPPPVEATAATAKTDAVVKPEAEAAAAASPGSAVKMELEAAADADTTAAAAAADAEPSVKTEAGTAADADAAAAAAKAAAAAEAARIAEEAQAAAAAAAAAAQSDDAIKAMWLQQQEELYTASKAQLLARKQFETGIRRPYWHIKPLDAVQLRNWGAYLDWQEQQGDVAATVTLYERCLVPCAAYPEFWQRYVRWCEANHPDGAANALQRATAVFCKRQPGIFIFAARFYEAKGDADAARDQYKQLLTDVAPGLLEGVLASANFERRNGDAAAAAAVFDTAIEQQRLQQQQQQEEEEGKRTEQSNSSSNREADGSSGSSSDELGFLYLMYANFLRQACNDTERARSVLQRGLESCPNCKALFEAAIFFEETTPGDDRVDRVMALFDKVLAAKLSSSSSSSDLAGAGSSGKDAGDAAAPETAAAAAAGEAKNGDQKEVQQQQQQLFADDVLEEFSKRCVEFADMYADVATVRRVQQRHSKLFGLPSAAAAAAAKGAANGTAAEATRKRAAEDSAAAATASGSVGKAARTDAAATPAAAAAAAQDAAAAAAAAAGYYPPPPANAYGGYGGYGMPPYGHPGYPPAYGHYGYGGY